MQSFTLIRANHFHFSTFNMFSNFNCPSAWAFVSRVSGPRAQFPNSERVSLKQRMIFRAGQLPGLGLVMAFVNWWGSLVLRATWSIIKNRFKTSSWVPRAEVQPPAAQKMIVSILMLTNQIRIWKTCLNHPQDAGWPSHPFQFWCLFPPQASLALRTSERLSKKGRRRRRRWTLGREN